MSQEVEGDRPAGIPQEPRFTGFIRFTTEEDQTRGVGQILDIHGQINVHESPFPDSEQMVFGLNPRQYEILKQRLDEVGISHEVVEWPKGVDRPGSLPRGFTR